MRGRSLPLVAVLTGVLTVCHSAGQIAAREPPSLDFAPIDQAVPPLPIQPQAPSLPILWNLALAHNPDLQEAAAEVEAARGRLIQAGKYPNPRLIYKEDLLGTPQAPAGDISVEAAQELLTAGKRRLDIAIASRATEVAAIAAVGRKFQLLTRIRLAYADYLGWQNTESVSNATVASLEQGVEITRQQVEKAKIRPRTDLIRLRAVLQEAKLTRDQAGTSRLAAWRALVAEVGVPDLPCPAGPAFPEGAVPSWEAGAVLRRVLAMSTELRQAAAQTERARLEVERARAEACPNVTITGGYTQNLPEKEHGALIAVETPLPLWDRKQGRRHEAEANWARTQAAERTLALRLSRETAEAIGRFENARHQVARLSSDIVPALAESLALVRQGYRTGGLQIPFADVLLAVQSLNEARLRLAEAQRQLGRAIADLQGLMQLEIGEELGEPSHEPSGKCLPELPLPYTSQPAPVARPR
jgi:cobalt-zinc-cadmium efflux system outer membrane protein